MFRLHAVGKAEAPTHLGWVHARLPVQPDLGNLDSLNIRAVPIREALHRVNDPEIHRPITDLGMVDDSMVDAAGRARVRVLLTVSGCPMKRHAAARRNGGGPDRAGCDRGRCRARRDDG